MKFDIRRIPILIILVAGLAIFLGNVFDGRVILPQTFSLGPFTIHYYGIIMALAVAGGFYLAVKHPERYGLAKQQAEDILFWIIIGGFIGARMYHVLSSLGYYRDNVIDILKVWNGGLSIYGAILGGLAVLFFYRAVYKDSPWQPRGILVLLNWLTPSLILGQIIGRFGNLFNYEAFGYPTNLPWKMFVPAGFRPNEYLDFNFFHPWFLYEQIGNLLILIIVLRLERRPSSGAATEDGLLGKSGALFLYYLLLYNILRFGLEFLRIDSTIISGFRLNSLISLMLIIISAVLIIRERKLESV